MKSPALAALIAALLAARCLLAQEPPSLPVPARAVAFSADGKRLAIGYGTKETAGGVLIWDVGQRRTVLQSRLDRGVSTVALSPDGRLVAFSIYDRAPQLLEIPSGQIVAVLAEDRRGPIAFSPDGQTLATGCMDKTIPLFDVKTRADRQVLSGAKDRTYGCFAFSSDGRLLLTPCGTAGVYLWDLASGRPRHVLQHRTYFTRSALFSPDGRWIVTGGWDGTTRIWDAASGEMRARFSGTGGVDALAYAADSKLLAICGGGNEVLLMELPLDEPTAEQVAQVRALVARFDDDGINAREQASAELVKLGFVAEAELKRATAESPSAEARIRSRRARQAILAAPQGGLTGHESEVSSAVFSQGGKLLASGSDDGTIRLWTWLSARRSPASCPGRMSHVSSLTLVRHAQASFLADVYDQLSALGQEQARLLGAWWAARQWSPDEVYVGPRQRQRQTAEEVASTFRQAGLPFPELVPLPDLDEYDLEGLLRRLAPMLAREDKDFASLHERQRHGASEREQALSFQRMFEPLLRHWQSAAGTLQVELESWFAFQIRVQRCLRTLTTGTGHGRRVVAFTSGGFIAAAVQQVLGAPDRTALEINWRIRNTALTEFVFSRERITLDVFNSTAHLASPELVTYR